jgi:hypothetical protein
VQLEGLGKLKKFRNLIGIGTRDHPACSIVPQSTIITLALISCHNLSTYDPLKCVLCGTYAFLLEERFRKEISLGSNQDI